MKTNKTEEKVEKKKEKKEKLPKEISQEILKKMFMNILRAIGVMIYFVILNLAYSTMKQDRLMADIEVFAGVFLVTGIYMLEKAYKKDSGTDTCTAIELLVLSIHSLTIKHVITMFQYEFQYYLLTSSYIISIYYVFKAIILYTKGRKEYLNSLSDVSEIVKKDEPLKKEAKKRNNKEVIKKEEKQEVKSEKKVEEKKESKLIKQKSIKVGKKESKKNTKTKEIEIKTETKTEEKPKKKRGRPKKEVKEND